MTILEAARKWVGELDAIPQNVIVKLMAADPDEISEITPVTVGDSVYAPGIGEAEVIEISGDTAKVQATGDGAVQNVDIADLEALRYDALPIWGTLWSFSDILDNEWLEGHLQEMADCGFRIYEQEDYGYIFGIDGAGYDFYESHWIPLYRARGLHWEDLAV